MPIDLTYIQLPFTTIEAIEAQIAQSYSSRVSKSGIQQLSEITTQLGIVEAGEIRLGNGVLPGSGFTGLRLGYPPIVTSEGDFHLAGFNNDIVQIGLDADDGTLGWGYSDGVAPNPDPIGFSGILDASGIRILYDLDPPANLTVGGARDFAGQRSLSFVDDLDPDTGVTISKIGVVYITGDTDTHITWESVALDGVGTLKKNIEATNNFVDSDVVFTLVTTYPYSVAPLLHSQAKVVLTGDGTGGTSTVLLYTDDDSGDIASVLVNPKTSIQLLTPINIPVDIPQFIQLTEISAPTGNPAANKKWIYTTAKGDLLVEDEDGVQTNLLSSSGGGSELPRYSIENIPWLVGLWPLGGSPKDVFGSESFSISDASVGQDGEIVYVEFDGTDDYLYKNDSSANSITGNLSAHGWVYFNNVASAIENVLAKWRDDNNSRSYRAIRNALGKFVFQISDSGFSISNSVTSTSTVGAGVWVFWYIKYTVSTEMEISIGINGAALETDINVTSIASEIDDNGSRLQLGAKQSGFSSVGEEMTGRQTRVALHNGVLDDATRDLLYSQGKELFGL